MTSDDLEGFYAGDEAYFRFLVESYSPRVLAMVQFFVQEGDEAYDLLQRIWIRAYEKRRTFAGTGSLLGWLFAICRNECASAMRRPTAPRVSVVELSDPPSEALPPDAEAARGELRRAIYAALLDLPQRERDVVVLRMLEGRSTRETAEAMGCAEGTVKAALHHAFRKLREMLRGWQ